MRSPIVILIALAVAVILIAQPVAALPILRAPFVRAGPVWALSPSMEADFVFIQTNASHLFASDTEAIAISFVPAGIGSGGPGGFTAAPVIAQTSSRLISCDRSFFVIDKTLP
jgi:hypothetical protein